MTKYIKTATIDAEQFDGSQRMIQKYYIIVSSTLIGDYAVEPSSCYIKTSKDSSRVHIGDWIATNDSGDHWAIADDIFKQTYQELPVIPKNVALYIDDLKRGLSDMGENVNQAQAIIAAVDYDQASGDIADWIQAYGDLFARAWLNGYEIVDD